ncbi:MAG: cation:proton antiporter [Candidatus Korarchaeota archaeon]|nr:cation:proton antiporter [Candidatus Korarchaeota archaeon]
MEIVELAILGILAIFAPLIARKSGIPCVVLEIIMGIVVGNSFLKLINPSSPWFSFLFDFGLIYILFLAGLEVELEFLREHTFISLLVGSAATFIPFLLGFALGSFLGINPWLIGVVSSTTSVGVVLPTVVEMEYLFEEPTKPGSVPFTKLLLGATAVSDMLSMFLLAFFVEGVALSGSSLLVILLSILILYPSYKLVKVYSKLTKKVMDLERRYHFSARLSMVLMIIFTALAELSGVHGVVGAFFAGVIVSQLIYSSEYLLRNLASFGYALFLPMFFLLVGVKVNIVDAILKTNVFLLPGLIGLSLLGKVIGTAISARKELGLKRSVIMGMIMWAKLSLVIAAAETGLRLGTLDETLYSSLVLYSLITAFGAPFLARFMFNRRNSKGQHS